MRLWSFVKRSIAAAALAAGITWVADYAILAHKVNREDPSAFGEVEVRVRYAIALKNKRIEQSPEQRQIEECVRSIFPHYDESPCWYLERHREEFLNVDGTPYHFWQQ